MFLWAISMLWWRGIERGPSDYDYYDYTLHAQYCAVTTYLHHSIDYGLYRWFNVAATGDHEERVLEISAKAWMCVCAAHDHIILSVKISILYFQLSQNLQWI